MPGRLPGGKWGHAVWFGALATAALVAALGVEALVVFLGTDAKVRPDSQIEWSLYAYVLNPAGLLVCFGGLVIAWRLYRRARAGSRTNHSP